MVTFPSMLSAVSFSSWRKSQLGPLPFIFIRQDRHATVFYGKILVRLKIPSTKSQIISKALLDILKFSQETNKWILSSSKNKFNCLFFGTKNSFWNCLTFINTWKKLLSIAIWAAKKWRVSDSLACSFKEKPEILNNKANYTLVLWSECIFTQKTRKGKELTFDLNHDLIFNYSYDLLQLLDYSVSFYRVVRVYTILEV